jgi:hypothetical protein
MSERRDEQWLDDQLKRAVGGRTPVFDAEAWKQRHPGEFQTLLARGGQGQLSLSPGTFWRRVFLGPFGRFAAPAAIAAVVVGLIFLAGRPDTSQQGSPTVGSPTAESPADMVSLMSLTMAYRQGGDEALNRQLDTALNELGPRPDAIVTLLLPGQL